MSAIDFEILIDDRLSSLIGESRAVDKDHLLTLVNDFEDNSWRLSRFSRFVFDHLPEACLSKRERDALADQSFTALQRGVANLRLIDSDQATEGSEIAEILLYGIMRKHYSALPVVPKIFYKQNSRDNAKGADSVHIVVSGCEFSIWFGECKFYNSIGDARLGTVITSVKESLSTQKLKKENSIITSVSDLNEYEMEASLRQRIVNTLSDDRSIDDIKPLLHIPILLLHECATTAECKEMSADYRKTIIAHHTDRASHFFEKQRISLSSIAHFDKITFHLILFPVPSKKAVVDSFLNLARALRV